MTLGSINQATPFESRTCGIPTYSNSKTSCIPGINTDSETYLPNIVLSVVVTLEGSTKKPVLKPASGFAMEGFAFCIYCAMVEVSDIRRSKRLQFLNVFGKIANKGMAQLMRSADGEQEIGNACAVIAIWHMPSDHRELWHL